MAVASVSFVVSGDFCLVASGSSSLLPDDEAAAAGGPS